jgi:hypothetical protein
VEYDNISYILTGSGNYLPDRQGILPIQDPWHRNIKIQINYCVIKGDAEMGGDKGMSVFQIYYLHIPIHPHIPLVTLSVLYSFLKKIPD